MSEPKKFLSVKHIVFMIIVQVLAFNNIPRCYYQMGYSAIPILILAALLFFVPYSFMMAEYGSALRDDAGGLYNWMERSLGTKFAFCGSLLNYAGTLVWFMLVVASSEWVYLSAMISGGDTTGAWSILGLTSAQTLGILGVVLTLVLTIIAVSGLENISKFFSVGGSLVMGLVGVLMVGGVLVLICNGGQFAQPLSAYGFFHSPNESYQSTGGIISFFAFAILAYGGSEIFSSVTDQTKDAGRTIPKAMLFSAGFITVAYCLGIFVCGMFTNWAEFSGQINMGNAAVIIMKNLGFTLASSFGASEAAALTISHWFARIVGLILFCSTTSCILECMYTSLKSTIQGTPKGLWPEWIQKVDPKTGTLKNALWGQCGIISVFVLAVAFGGKGIDEFFNLLLVMTTIANTIPYAFLSGAFPAFKRLDLERPYVFYKTQTSAKIASLIVTGVILFANAFCIIEPAMSGDWSSTIWSVVGPLFFFAIALIMVARHNKKVRS